MTGGSLGFVLLLVCGGLLSWRRRGAFYRRNSAGVQEFRSFGHAAITNTIDRFVELVASIGVAVGILSLIFAHNALHL